MAANIPNIPQEDINANKGISVLSYIGIFFLIPMLAKKDSSYCRFHANQGLVLLVHVDAENYRVRREESLQRLARKMAGKAIKYRRNMTLEPMNAYERHVIHTTLQNYPGVSTYSTGSEPNRRTIVVYDPSQT